MSTILIYLQNLWALLIKKIIEFPYDAAISLLGIDPKGQKTISKWPFNFYIHYKTQQLKSENNPYVRTDEWIKDMLYTDYGILCSYKMLKLHKFLLHG